MKATPDNHHKRHAQAIDAAAAQAKAALAILETSGAVLCPGGFVNDHPQAWIAGVKMGRALIAARANSQAILTAAAELLEDQNSHGTAAMIRAILSYAGFTHPDGTRVNWGTVARDGNVVTITLPDYWKEL